MDPDEQNETGLPADPPEAAPATRPAPARSPRNDAYTQQVREAARRAGDAERRAADAERRAAEAEAAAEARIAEMQAQQVRDILGDEGLAVWEELAALSAQDQVRAAQRFAEVMSVRTAEDAPTATAATTIQQAPAVPSATPVVPRTLDGSAPLTAAPGEAMSARIAAREKQFADAVAKNQRRDRLTTAERGDAMVAYLEASYLKAMQERGV